MDGWMDGCVVLMTPPLDLASRLLRFEQQLEAYQKLHTDELAELWRVLRECKREIASALADQPRDEEADGTARGVGPAGVERDEWPLQGDDGRESRQSDRPG
ncbi:MAG: hypothetical protein M5U01_33835 [Ardenticatenaceae bacterium]|nr:hypothetical protein [Ardenticatenaceae bacterium]HBY98344.1 hypothetical protein [Chloroflexota bacterium]